MAFTSGRASRFILDAADFGTSLRECVVRSTADLLETSNFGQAGAKSYQVGLIDGRLTMNGYYEPGAGKADATMFALVGAASDSLYCFAPQVDGVGLWTLGRRVFMVSGRQASYNLASPVAEMVNFGAEVSCDLSRACEAGISLHDPGPAGYVPTQIGASETTATGFDETTIYFPATTNFGAAIHLHVVENTRTATTVIKVQHSSDGVTYNDFPSSQGIFTTIPATPNGTVKERIYIASGTTINKWVRINSTLNAGTGYIRYLVAWARYPF